MQRMSSASERVKLVVSGSAALSWPSMRVATAVARRESCEMRSNALQKPRAVGLLVAYKPLAYLAATPPFCARSHHCKRAGFTSTASASPSTGPKTSCATHHTKRAGTATAKPSRRRRPRRSKNHSTDGRARRRRPGPPQGVGRPLDGLLRGPRPRAKGVVGPRVE